ncbi:MAG: SH3 domain-containing protein [Lachnospiraceae bacterium]|nr:SH3 domain-containing protein [Lachnospiraceae bacterium]
MEKHGNDKKRVSRPSSPQKDNKPSALTDYINKVVTFFKNNKKFGIVLFVAAGLILMVLILDAVNQKEKPEETIPSSTDHEIIVSPPEETTEDPTIYELKKDAIPQLNELVGTYFAAMKNNDAEAYSNIVAGDDMTEEKLRKKGEYIEDYQNISCYTKPGMTDGTYVTYVYYEVKFLNVDTLCPALSQLYICTNEDGTMYINAGPLSSELAGYINTIGNDEQVLDLIHETDRKMEAAMNGDEKLSVFVQKLRELAVYETEPATEEPETDISEMTFEERDENVLTTTTVRVRSTPSTDTDDNVIGRLAAGEKVKRVGYNGKWSKIIYQGEEAYASSDYLITN